MLSDVIEITFHHIGVACTDIEMETRHYTALGYRVEGSPFEDQTQGVAGRFLVGPGPRLELLAELPGRSALTPWLRKGIRLYHLCWEAANLDASIAVLVAAGAKTVVAPTPAVAFGGRPITFLVLPNRQLVELIGPPEWHGT